MDDVDKVPDPVPNPGDRRAHPAHHHHGAGPDILDAPPGPKIAVETVNFEIGRDQVHIPVTGKTIMIRRSGLDYTLADP